MVTLVKQQMNDLIKNEYCILRDIPIMWLPYWIHTKDLKMHIHDFVESHMDKFFNKKISMYTNEQV